MLYLIPETVSHIILTVKDLSVLHYTSVGVHHDVRLKLFYFFTVLPYLVTDTPTVFVSVSLSVWACAFVSLTNNDHD